MKITAVLLPSVDEQIAAGDTDIIDPRGVDVGKATGVLVWKNFSYEVPKDLFGKLERVWIQNDRLMGEITVIDEPFHFGVGGIVDPTAGFQLHSVGVMPGKQR